MIADLEVWRQLIGVTFADVPLPIAVMLRTRRRLIYTSTVGMVV